MSATKSGQTTLAQASQPHMAQRAQRAPQVRKGRSELPSLCAPAAPSAPCAVDSLVSMSLRAGVSKRNSETTEERKTVFVCDDIDLPQRQVTTKGLPAIP